MSGLGLNVNNISTKLEKFDTFYVQFYHYFASSTDLKNPRFVEIAVNLTHFVPNYDTPGLEFKVYVSFVKISAISIKVVLQGYQISSACLLLSLSAGMSDLGENLVRLTNLRFVKNLFSTLRFAEPKFTVN